MTDVNQHQVHWLEKYKKSFVHTFLKTAFMKSSRQRHALQIYDNQGLLVYIER